MLLSLLNHKNCEPKKRKLSTTKVPAFAAQNLGKESISFLLIRIRRAHTIFGLEKSSRKKHTKRVLKKVDLKKSFPMCDIVP